VRAIRTCQALRPGQKIKAVAFKMPPIFLKANGLNMAKLKVIGVPDWKSGWLTNSPIFKHHPWRILGSQSQIGCTKKHLFSWKNITIGLRVPIFIHHQCELFIA